MFPIFYLILRPTVVPLIVILRQFTFNMEYNVTYTSLGEEQDVKLLAKSYTLYKIGKCFHIQMQHLQVAFYTWIETMEFTTLSVQ